tara:strand:+ start:580 stop:2343 length:1764 start_codon:yes stop_codon:yes gene_type:complete
MRNYSDFQDMELNKLFCSNVLIVQSRNTTSKQLTKIGQRFKFNHDLDGNYYVFSDAPVFETTTSVSIFTGYAIHQDVFIENQNYRDYSFHEDYIGNYLYFEFDKKNLTLRIVSDFFTNAMKFIYKDEDLIILSNNLPQLFLAIQDLVSKVTYDFNNINFNLRIAIEVSDSNNYFPYFNQFNIERSEIIGYEYVKPFYDLFFDKVGRLSYIKKEIIRKRDHKYDFGYYVEESKKEMIDAYNALAGQFPKHEYCSDLTAGADSRCLLSIFLENGVHEMNYQVTLKGKKSVASIGMTDAYYFQYFRERFNLSAVSLSKYIAGHYSREEYELFEEHFFSRNPHQYTSMANNLRYENLLSFRGGYGEIFRNYLNFVCSNELQDYFRRQINSDELYTELKRFLTEQYGFLTQDLCQQHNLNYIFFRQRETVVYNKWQYPFYNLPQSKNMYFAKELANLADDNYALLKEIYTEDLRHVNINNRNRISDSVLIEDVNIDSLYELKWANAEIVSQGLAINRKLGDDYFFDKLLSNLESIKTEFLDHHEDSKYVSDLIESIQRNRGSFNNWRIKNLHYRIKKLKYTLKLNLANPQGI